MTKPAWDLSENELGEMSLLEHLYDGEGQTTPAHVDLPDIERHSLSSFVGAAEAHGYVKSFPRIRRMSEVISPLRLEADGIAYVERIRRARNSKVERNRAARTALLNWMFETADGLPTNSSLFLEADVNFYGTQFTEGDLTAAADFLTENGMVRGTHQANGVLVHATLTATGIQCVEDHEGDLRAYEEARRLGGVSNTQVFQGSFSGQNAQGTDIVQVQQAGVDADELLTILAAIRATVAGLPDDDEREDIEIAIDDLERDATADQPDATVVRKRLGLLRRLSTRAAESGATALGTGAGTELLTQIERLGHHLM